MQKPNSIRLWRLMWWSVRLAWAHNKKTRYRVRMRISEFLMNRWRFLAPESPPGLDWPLCQAIWLGSLLAARSLWRSPGRQESHIPRRLLWLFRLLGTGSGRAVAGAYLAWIRLAELAEESRRVGDSWRHTPS
ncbi:hypothetical protein Sulac_2892 [Sulfobacillus acidophilus DSM 10332]|uniref:Uncharacterized protein n=1 Tax=Sulfobacillus acidophilus (strain ATCC 700253 / DSM 10332 / NAL) TaxID=679936 RepID=G8TZ83_SULAD|nr:hypothetical protein Sulac_2892 [Sulfobacillus acidophilus DSM 10332]